MSEKNAVQELIKSYLEIYYEKTTNKDHKRYLIYHLFASNLDAQAHYLRQKKLLDRDAESIALMQYPFKRQIKQIKYKTIRFLQNHCIVNVTILLEFYTQTEQLVRGSIKNNRQIKLTKINGKWYIAEDSYLGECGREDREQMTNDKKKIPNRSRAGDKEKVKASSKKQAVDEKFVVPKGSYDRQAAVAYALKYAMKPNVQKWHNYERWGGDCTNFVSQCLYAGGIPFDHIGDSPLKKWFWYSDDYRTPTWTSANALKEYMLHNRGYGLVAKLARKEEMEIGDIVQLGTLEQTTHSMIVVDILYKEGNNKEMIDLLVAQRSDEGGIHGVNIPLSLKPQEQLYYKIMGYNPQKF